MFSTSCKIWSLYCVLLHRHSNSRNVSEIKQYNFRAVTLSVFLYSSCTIQITFTTSEGLLDVKRTKGHLCKRCPFLYTVKWKEPWIVTRNAGVLLPASLLALGDQIGEWCHCCVPLLLFVQWGGHCSALCSIWVYLWKVACKRNSFFHS